MVFSTRLSFTTIRAIVRESPRWVVGVALLTPAVALIQGSALIANYRKHHLHAPYPISPSQGVVVSVQDQQETTLAIEQRRQSKRQSKQQTLSKKSTSLTSTFSSTTTSLESPIPSSSPNPHANKPPLRLLVIGDSLAAGVGVLHSATPVLPESMARTLSRRMGGRPVYWTCVGKPGAGVQEIIRDIETHDQTLLVRHESTQQRRRMVQQQPLWKEAVEDSGLWERRERLVQWWQQRKERHERVKARVESKDQHDDTTTPQDDNNNNNNNNQNSSNPIVAWWQNLTDQVREDVHSFRQAWQGPLDDNNNNNDNDDEELDFDDDEEDRIAALTTKNNKHTDPIQLWQKWKRRLQRRQSLLGETVGQYDIAVVMTGANDLKHAWFPFMMKREDVQVHGSSSGNDSNNSNHEQGQGMPERLKTVVTTLQRRMKLVLDGNRPSEDDDETTTSNDKSTIEVATSSLELESLLSEGTTTTRNPPLIVFPAMPITMIPQFHNIGLDGNRPSEEEKETNTSLISNDKSMIEVATSSLELESLLSSEGTTTTRNPPLIVFPAMPITMIPQFHNPPMSWFVFAVFRHLENYKRAMAKQFPGAVVFVEPPPMDEILSGDGKLLQEDIQPAQEVILALTNVTQRVRKRMERALQEHREKWAKVLSQDQEEQSQHKDESQQHHHHPDESFHEFENGNARDTSIMLSIDKLHPSDAGYEIWGRHIAQQVLKEWNFEDAD
eukprot:CAMPEP_0172474130 /NCGR_PEP_ID=MMETSP1065-20121228/69197_1 /TAXON_ID=265537 /ORGANISM="Amphiprora paludosa, Strain CCMP125" /LENGTH=724 /DNA_ID=CAMNT_0013232309 /DNA_START=111 /DNA_END=2286 /DNA_ORIENTATION=+